MIAISLYNIYLSHANILFAENKWTTQNIRNTQFSYILNIFKFIFINLYF